MGCWNKTCGFSGLSIMVGDPVYVFVLKKSDYYDPCSSTSEYTPFLAPFESFYNDYGSGENSRGVWLPYIMEALKKKLIEMEVGENKCHDIAVKRDDFDVDLFFSAIKEDRLFINKHQPSNAIRFTMMHKSIIDKMLEEFEFRHYDFFREMGKWDYKFADIITRVENYWNNIKSFYNIHQLIDFNYDSIIGSYIFHYMSTINFIPIREVIGECLQNNTEDEVAINLIKEYLKGLHVEIMMNHLRKTWLPGGFEGSQDCEYDAYKLLVNITLEHIKEKEEELDY
jgi:hypothetical protein